MPTFEEVKAGLEKDPRIIVAGGMPPYCGKGDVVPRSYLYVAPTLQLFEADQLQEFMNSLLPELGERDSSEFVQHQDYLQIGQLIFSDICGTHDKEIVNKYTFHKRYLVKDGVQHVKTRRTRRYNLIMSIIINIYPNAEFARTISQSKNPYLVPTQMIRQYIDLDDRLSPRQ